MTLGLILTALTLGLRHGVDWDHIAAIADLSSTARNRRHGFWLSFVYAGWHGIVVIVLGLLAIAFGSALPEGVDVWMGRVVGATLVILGAWILIDLLRSGRDFRLRSRWILVLSGTFAGLRRVRDARRRRRVVIEHDHDHAHGDLADPDHAEPPAHEHAHGAHAHGADVQDDEIIDLVAEPVGAGATRSRSMADHQHGSGRRGHRHSHAHAHELSLGEYATAHPGNGTAAGVGVLHGIGFESPTQIAIFVASTSVAGVGGGIVLLVAWVAGLVIANSGLALLAAFGLLHAERNFAIYATIAVLVALASLAMGGLLIAGLDVLPALN